VKCSSQKTTKKIAQCVERLGLGGLGCKWANVGFCGAVVVRGVDVVADGGREVCFVVVYGGWGVRSRWGKRWRGGRCCGVAESDGGVA
jgi:hypothetical protein